MVHPMKFYNKPLITLIMKQLTAQQARINAYTCHEKILNVVMDDISIVSHNGYVFTIFDKLPEAVVYKLRELGYTVEQTNQLNYKVSW